MAHCNTVLNQVVVFFKRHEFESLARKHHVGQKFRSFNRWSQFMGMMVCQLSGRKSLRDVVAIQKAKWYRETLSLLRIKYMVGFYVCLVSSNSRRNGYESQGR